MGWDNGAEIHTSILEHKNPDVCAPPWLVSLAGRMVAVVSTGTAWHRQHSGLGCSVRDCGFNYRRRDRTSDYICERLAPEPDEEE